MRFVIFCAAMAFGSAAVADSSNQIPHNDKLRLKVGQSVIVTGWRGDCGQRPGNVNSARTRDTELGTLSIGRWGVMKSRTCGGNTPAVEIIFTAKKKGRETINVNSNVIQVTVR